MPQFEPVVLMDRAATPEEHTFYPRDIVNNVASFEESTGIPIANNRLTASVSRTGQGRHKVTLKGTFPIVQNAVADNGVSSPLVVRRGYFDCTFSFEDTSTEDERRNIVGILASALAEDAPVFSDAITKLQAIY